MIGKLYNVLCFPSGWLIGIDAAGASDSADSNRAANGELNSSGGAMDRAQELKSLRARVLPRLLALLLRVLLRTERHANTIQQVAARLLSSEKYQFYRLLEQSELQAILDSVTVSATALTAAAGTHLREQREQPDQTEEEGPLEKLDPLGFPL